MPTYLSPGVYMEEVSSGSKPIEGVGTAVAGFVGFAAKGPAHEPTLVTNWTQYTATFGDFIEGSFLAHAVYGYFLNGGGAAYVVRVGGDDDAAVAASAELPAAADASKKPLVARALEAGPDGEGITVEVSDASEPADDTFKLTVRAPGKPDEVFDNVTTKRSANAAIDQSPSSPERSIATSRTAPCRRSIAVSRRSSSIRTTVSGRTCTRSTTGRDEARRM